MKKNNFYLPKFKYSTLSSGAFIYTKKGFGLRETESIPITGHITKIINIKNNRYTLYPSIRTAAIDMRVSHVTLLNYIDKDKLLKGTYLISRVII